ncbi:MAG: hypothetical protein EXS59_00640 [Candidatus Taylorbacteria bacterium]|nr:hypothetical protein [Candidatus Taylorbacteria bacterium]
MLRKKGWKHIEQIQRYASFGQTMEESAFAQVRKLDQDVFFHTLANKCHHNVRFPYYATRPLFCLERPFHKYHNLWLNQS